MSQYILENPSGLVVLQKDCLHVLARRPTLHMSQINTAPLLHQAVWIHHSVISHRDPVYSILSNLDKHDWQRPASSPLLIVMFSTLLCLLLYAQFSFQSLKIVPVRVHIALVRSHVTKFQS